MMKNIFLFIICLLTIGTLSAQQDIILTKYSTNPIFFNPAYAGSKGANNIQITANYRDQWLGLEGSPKTLMAGANGNFFKDKVGLGVTLATENIGVDNRLSFQTNYAYRILLEDAYVVGGLRFGLHRYSSNLADIRYSDAQDNIYDQGAIASNALTMGFGAYYYTEDYFVGLSVPTFATISNDQAPDQSPHYYLHTGAFISVEDSEMRLEPTILLKYEKSVPLQYTLGANVWLMKSFAIGAHYRSTDALSLSAEFVLGELFNIGASYDFTLSDLNKETVGSMELTLDYIFNLKREEIPMGRRKGF